MQHVKLSALLTIQFLHFSATGNNSQKLIKLSVFWNMTSTKVPNKKPCKHINGKIFAAQKLFYSYSDTSKMQGATHCGTITPNPINPFLRLKNILLRTCAFISVLLVKLLSQNFLLNPPHFKKVSALNMPTQISSTKLRFDTTLNKNVEPSCLNLSGHTTNNTMQWKLLKAKWAHRTVIWNYISEACCLSTN